MFFPSQKMQKARFKVQITLDTILSKEWWMALPLCLGSLRSKAVNIGGAVKFHVALYPWLHVQTFKLIWLMGFCPVSSPQSLFKHLNKQGPLHYAKQQNEALLYPWEQWSPDSWTLHTEDRHSGIVSMPQLIFSIIIEDKGERIYCLGLKAHRVL